MVPATKMDSAVPTTAAQASRLLSWALLGLLAVLLVEVLFEAWIQIQLGTTSVDDRGKVVADLPQWPKTLKNGIYLTLAVLSVAKVAVDRRWREFTTKADAALVVLALVLAVAGLVGGSGLTLTAEGVFVYLRGVIVFYAWRALAPPWRRVRPVLLLVGGIVAANAVLAVGQSLLGKESYRALGWADLTWAKIHRAHALLNHPNHLGHVLGFAVLGMIAWFATRRDRPEPRWWLLFGLLALDLSATQSRESAIAALAGGGLIWVLRRGRGRVIAVCLLIVGALFAAQIALRPANRVELQRRLAGVLMALHIGSGEEPEGACVKGNPDCTDDQPQIPQREIRILFAQQGVRLWLRSPIIGYGVGQFGGIVAHKHDPNWNMNPRFGPDGFNMYGFEVQQVDSFWLHLLVETGAVGVLTYLVWLLFLALPLLRALPEGRRHRIRGPTEPGSPFAYWGLASLLFAVLVAALSPSLEDPILPALLFSIVGLAWVDLRRPLLPAAAGGPSAPTPGTAAQDAGGPAGEDGPPRAAQAP